MAIIDNEKVDLRSQLQSLLPETQRASIAVGYFFISGFAEIMDRLDKIEKSDNPGHIMRLLISPSTNRQTAEAMLASHETYEEAQKASQMSWPASDSWDTVKDEIKKTLEYMPQSDREILAVRKLIDLIQRKKVQIKVYTKDRLHAKAYIFEMDPNSQRISNVAIVGSSNLSISGIKEHTELNLLTSHDGDNRDLLDWFDRHWNDESCMEFTKDMAQILGNSWAGREHTPDDVYGKAAWYEHPDIFDDGPIDMFPGDAPELFGFQKKAVADAIKKLDACGGVIIADVVGMGKSYIGSAVLKYLKEQEHSKPLIICPPHLKEMWEQYLSDFEIYGEVESRYMIGKESNILRKHTHCNVILIDESHNFRNSTTNAYKAFSAFMEEKADDAKIIMLSATPVSNGIMDLKNQLKLFPRDGLERIPALGTVSLDEYFTGLGDAAGPSPEGADKIRELLKYILIRRTRSQIISRYAKPDGDRWYLEQADGRKYFPQRRLQNPEEYDADKVYNNAYESIETAIENLKLARYAPGRYLLEQYASDQKYKDLLSTTKPLVGIVRSSLLKRMESSIKAFHTSITNYQNGYRIFKKQLQGGLVPIGKEFHDEIYKKIEYDDYDDGDFEENLSKIPTKYKIEAFDKAKWIADIDSDLSKLAEILGHLSGEEFTKRDDKLHKLCDLIRGKDEKILIFSESAVTAKYIHSYLVKIFPDRKIGQIDSKQDVKTKNILVKRFDPQNNKADILKNEELDILVSTDVLSEGVNLHAGKIVVNYDFHWNPVRLIQRVGRIDRIGSEHPVIDVFNFLPTTKIESKLSLKERVANKITTIRRIIGHDQKILEESEIIDESSVSAIYNPDENSDSVLDSGLAGILDMEETESEKRAVEIKNDAKQKEYFENLQFGIRGVSGHGKLLVACEAEEVTIIEGLGGGALPYERLHSAGIMRLQMAEA